MNFTQGNYIDYKKTLRKNKLILFDNINFYNNEMNYVHNIPQLTIKNIKHRKIESINDFKNSNSSKITDDRIPIINERELYEYNSKRTNDLSSERKHLSTNKINNNYYIENNNNLLKEFKIKNNFKKNVNNLETSKDNRDKTIYNKDNNNNINESLIMTINEIEPEFCLCSICDNFFLKTEIFYADCHLHFFCKKCGKLFYEEKIEEGEKKLFCPIFKCLKPININIVEKFVSEEHFKSFQIATKKYSMDNNNNKNNFVHDQILENKFKKEKIQIKKYIQSHVLDIDDNKLFYLFNKSKLTFCPKCKENALFSKTNNKFIKCLNCFSKICKFCLREFNDKHLFINNIHHCKVYFKKKYEKNSNNFLKISKSNYFNQFLLQILIIIISYFIILFGIYNYIFNFFESILIHKKKRKKHLYFLVFFLTSIISILFSMFFLILFPYFPIFNEIFN